MDGSHNQPLLNRGISHDMLKDSCQSMEKDGPSLAGGRGEIATGIVGV
jgi:hypothetical protein